jgi:hypothetical protein
MTAGRSATWDQWGRATARDSRGAQLRGWPHGPARRSETAEGGLPRRSRPGADHLTARGDQGATPACAVDRGGPSRPRLRAWADRAPGLLGRPAAGARRLHRSRADGGRAMGVPVARIAVTVEGDSTCGRCRRPGGPAASLRSAWQVVPGATPGLARCRARRALRRHADAERSTGDHGRPRAGPRLAEPPPATGARAAAGHGRVASAPALFDFAGWR